MIRLPFAPLEQAVARKINRIPTADDLCIQFRITRTMLSRYREAGLTVWTADKFAVSLNLHPISVWGTSAWINLEVDENNSDNLVFFD